MNNIIIIIAAFCICKQVTSLYHTLHQQKLKGACTSAQSHQSSLFARTKIRSRGYFKLKIRDKPHLISVHACFKNELALFSEKTDVLLTQTLKFDVFCSAVTLGVRTRSLKLNQVFIMPQCYIHINMVPICPLVQETAHKIVSG